MNCIQIQTEITCVVRKKPHFCGNCNLSCKIDYSCWRHRLPENLISQLFLLCHPEQPIIPPHIPPKNSQEEKNRVQRIILKHRPVPWSRLTKCPCGELDHRMVWIGKDLKDHLVPTPLPWAGTPSTRS